MFTLLLRWLFRPVGRLLFHFPSKLNLFFQIIGQLINFTFRNIFTINVFFSHSYKYASIILGVFNESKKMQFLSDKKF